MCVSVSESVCVDACVCRGTQVLSIKSCAYYTKLRGSGWEMN